MTTWTALCLGLIALGSVISALAQVGTLLATRRLAHRVERLADAVAADLAPILTSLQAMTRDAAGVSALLAAQAARLDRLLTDVLDQLEAGAMALRQAIGTGAREGAALLAGVRAVLALVRRTRQRRRRERRDDDALFV